MTVILDQYAIPKTLGMIEIRQAVTINVSAADARRMVRRWASDEVAFMLTTAEPSLVVNEDQSVWRVPIILTATHIGHVGVAGTVDVDVETEEMLVDDQLKESINQKIAELSETLPPYQPRKAEGEATQYVVQDYKPTPRVISQYTPQEIIAAEKNHLSKI